MKALFFGFLLTVGCAPATDSLDSADLVSAKDFDQACATTVEEGDDADEESAEACPGCECRVTDAAQDACDTAPACVGHGTITAELSQGNTCSVSDCNAGADCGSQIRCYTTTGRLCATIGSNPANGTCSF